MTTNLKSNSIEIDIPETFFTDGWWKKPSPFTETGEWENEDDQFKHARKSYLIEHDRELATYRNMDRLEDRGSNSFRVLESGHQGGYSFDSRDNIDAPEDAEDFDYEAADRIDDIIMEEDSDEARPEGEKE
jgi:hypothetical protein